MNDAPVRTLLTLAATAGLAVAQVTPIPGTGCPGVQPTGVSPSNPTIGNSILIANVQTCTGGPITYNAMIAIGVQPASVSLPQCVTGQACVVGVTPFHILITPGFAQWNFQVPNNPALSGTCFLAQATCIFAPPPCPVRMQPAVQVCIQ